MMKVVFNADGTGHGVNCAVGDGQYAIEVDKTQLINGTEGKLYKDVGGVVVALSDVERESVLKEMSVLSDKASVEDSRLKAASSGVVYDGMIFKTDPQSRSDFTGVVLAFYMGLITESPWKCENGWYTLTTENYQPVAVAILGQMITAFNWEKAEQEKLETGE